MKGLDLTEDICGRMQIGNAVINDETDEIGMYEYLVSHALISDETWYAIQKYCDFSPNVTNQVDQCNSALNEADDDVSSIDIYNIYAPLCFSSNLTSHPKKTNVRSYSFALFIFIFSHSNFLRF